ncbi:hypothetical protein ACWAT4_39150 [Bradyrhizobium manausense]
MTTAPPRSAASRVDMRFSGPIEIVVVKGTGKSIASKPPILLLNISDCSMAILGNPSAKAQRIRASSRAYRRPTGQIQLPGPTQHGMRLGVIPAEPIKSTIDLLENSWSR